MWNSAKGALASLPTDVQELTRKAYAEVLKFNCLVDYDLAFGGPGTGKFDRALELAKDRIKESLTPAIEGVTKSLGEKTALHTPSH